MSLEFEGIAALDHWRLFWHRSKESGESTPFSLIITRAFTLKKARMELALQSEDAESQQKHFEKGSLASSRKYRFFKK